MSKKQLRTIPPATVNVKTAWPRHFNRRYRVLPHRHYSADNLRVSALDVFFFQLSLSRNRNSNTKPFFVGPIFVAWINPDDFLDSFQIDIFDLFSHSLGHCFSPFPMSTYGNCPHNFWQFDIFYAGGNDRINISFLYKFKQPFMFLHHFFSKRIGFELGCIADLRNWSLMLFILSLFREQFWVSEKCLMDRQY